MTTASSDGSLEEAPSYEPDGGTEHLASVDRECFEERIGRAYSLLDGLCLAVCVRTFLRFHLFGGAGEEISWDDAASRIHLVPEAKYLLDSALEYACQAGLLVRNGYSWRWTGASLSRLEIAPLWREIEREFPDEPMFELAARCLRDFSDVLQGRTRGFETFFPRGDLALWRRLHASSLFMAPYSRLAARSLNNALSEGCCVMEIGAGVGAAANLILNQPSASLLARYLYTDVSEVFLREGRRMFGAHSWFAAQRFDINDPLEGQGVPAGSLDAVIGVNVMHVARDLPAAAMRIRSLLRRDGLLVLGEGSPPSPGQMWGPDLLFGFLEDWWNVTIDPELRPRVGFLLVEEWARLLSQTGFAAVYTVPNVSPGKRRYGGVIVAKAA